MPSRDHLVALARVGIEQVLEDGLCCRRDLNNRGVLILHGHGGLGAIQERHDRTTDSPTLAVGRFGRVSLPGLEISVAFPIKVCSICSEEFELKPGKPGFANRCPACSEQDEAERSKNRADAAGGGSNRELNQERKKAIRDLLYRKDS